MMRKRPFTCAPFFRQNMFCYQSRRFSGKPKFEQNILPRKSFNIKHLREHLKKSARPMPKFQFSPPIYSRDTSISHPWRLLRARVRKHNNEKDQEQVADLTGNFLTPLHSEGTLIPPAWRRTKMAKNEQSSPSVTDPVSFEALIHSRELCGHEATGQTNKQTKNEHEKIQPPINASQTGLTLYPSCNPE
jgi:hypothetical protein